MNKQISENEVSRLLFGNAYFLPVCRDIYERSDREFTRGDLFSPDANPTLRRLIRLEMVERIEGYRSPNLFRRTEHLLWEVVSEALQGLRSLERSPAGSYDFVAQARSEREILQMYGSSLEIGQPLFGAPLRMRILLWLHDETEDMFSSLFYKTQTADGNCSVNAQIHRLEGAGLLTPIRTSAEGWGYTCWSRRSPSPLWAVVPPLWEFVLLANVHQLHHEKMEDYRLHRKFHPPQPPEWFNYPGEESLQETHIAQPV